MATTSEVKAGLDDIAAVIRAERAACAKAKARISQAESTLANLPTTYADVIATIDAYVPVGAFETMAKDEKSKLQTEFLALRTAATTAETALAAVTEF